MQLINVGFTPIYRISDFSSIRSDKSGSFNGVSFPAKAKFISSFTFLDDEDNEKKIEVIFQIPTSSDKMAVEIKNLLRQIRDKKISFDFKALMPVLSGKGQYTINCIEDDTTFYNYLSSLLSKSSNK